MPDESREQAGRVTGKDAPPNPPPFVLTLDVGTSSVRAILFDARARPVPDCVAQRQVRPTTTTDGGATFDAGELLAAVAEVIDQVLHSAGPNAKRIGAVAMGTLVGNVLGVNEAGQPVTPVYIYADTRNAEDAQTLRRELGAEGLVAAHDRTGCLVHTSYLPARFRWLARVAPEQWRQAVHWVSVGEYIYHEFLGTWRASYSVAAWTGLLHRQQLTWDVDWLRMLEMEAGRLSPLGDIDAPLQGLCNDYAGRWPALRDAAWLPAVGDGAAANIGSGCVGDDRIALTVGTTGAMRVVVDPALDRVPDGLWLYRVDARRGLLGGATTEGGNVFAWLRESLALPEAAQLEAQLEATPPAQHGLTVLPFWGGERAPGWREDARGTIGGLSLSTQPVEIVRACLEAMSYRFALIFARIAPHLESVTRAESSLAPEQKRGQPDFAIVASGGALLSSPAWLQLTADVLGRPLITSAEKEATSRGLAVLGLEQLGEITDAAQLPAAMGRTFEPNPEASRVYQEALARHTELYATLLG